MRYLISLIFILGFMYGQAQDKSETQARLSEKYANGSDLIFSDISTQQLDNLVLLGKVWGFLKYHHPEIAKGNFHWDYELLEFLSRYKDVQGNKKRDKALLDWIQMLGEVTPCDDCGVPSPNAVLRPDHDWMDDIDKHLARNLRSMLTCEMPNRHHYIVMNLGVGNPNFLNEEDYADMSFPDTGFRLISLYRYWNIIEYFSPYSHLIEKDWDAVLREYLPVFLNAESELAYEKALLRLLAEVGDSHGILLTGDDQLDLWKGQNYPPVHVRFIEDQLVVTDYFEPYTQDSIGLPIGTVITHINQRTVKELLEEKRPFYAASNEPTLLRNIAPDMLRSNDESVQITYRDGQGKAKDMTLPLRPRAEMEFYRTYPPYDGPAFKWLADSIGYVTLQNIEEADIWEIRKEFINARGIIIDIRNYPSTFVPFSLGQFFKSTKGPFVKFTIGDVRVPGQFIFTNPLDIYYTSKSFQNKLVVLVNEFTQSQAEYTSMAFRAGDNTTIIGSTTAGADGNVSKFSLPGGITTWITGIGVYYPDGTETQKVGIVPDIEVKPTIRGIGEGRDELMEAAIQLILEE